MTARHRLLSAHLSSKSGALLPWASALVGIGVMAGFAIYGVANQVGEPPVLEVPTEPSPIVELSPSVTPPASESPAPSLSPSPPPPDVVGRYRLVESFEDVFIGKVVITNTSQRAQDWTVKLAFPDGVGKVLDFWIDGEPQPDGRRLEDNPFAFTSTAPVQPESRVALKIRFARSGGDVDPIRCEVNGTPCLDG